MLLLIHVGWIPKSCFPYRSSVQTSSNAVVSGPVKNIGSSLLFDNKTKVIDNVQTSLSSWGNSRINQQVCPCLF